MFKIISIIILILIFGLWLVRKTSFIYVALILCLPTILVLDDKCEKLYYLDLSINLWVTTFINIIIEVFSNNLGKTYDGYGNWYYDSYFIVEIYSLLQVLLFYIVIRYFSYKYLYKYCIVFFSHQLFLAVTIPVLLLTLFLNLFYANPGSEYTAEQFSLNNNSFMLYYLLIYFSSIILLYYFQYKGKNINQIILYLLFFFFPVVTVTDDFRKIYLCQSENFYYENLVSISPLIQSIYETIKNLILSTRNEDYKSSINLNCYSIFQVIMISLIFPSILTPKEKNYAQ